jgi:hypothetical protein
VSRYPAPFPKPNDVHVLDAVEVVVASDEEGPADVVSRRERVRVTERDLMLALVPRAAPDTALGASPPSGEGGLYTKPPPIFGGMHRRDGEGGLYVAGVISSALIILED